LASREDELRLEGQLMVLLKIGTDNIDQHITKVENLIAAIMAQQTSNEKYDNDKRNQLFLQTLIHCKIPDEDWTGFVPYLGKVWHTMTPQAVFAEARIYYNSRILSNKTNGQNDVRMQSRVILTRKTAYLRVQPSTAFILNGALIEARSVRIRGSVDVWGLRTNLHFRCFSKMLL
jgi:hypothetical protein